MNLDIFPDGTIVYLGYFGVILFAASLALKYFFPEKIQGARAENLRVTTARYGDILARIHGRGPTAGRALWLEGNALKEHVHTERTGFLGLGPEVTTFSYTSTFAMALTDHEIDEVPRIWFDKKLIYDNTQAALDNVSTGTLIGSNGLSFRLYRGTDTQRPEPRLSADVGANKAEAYTGTSYIVVYDWDHTINNTGIRLPDVECEVVREATKQESVDSFDAFNIPNSSLQGSDADYDPENHLAALYHKTNGILACWTAQDQKLLFSINVAERDGFEFDGNAPVFTGLGHILLIAGTGVNVYDAYTGQLLQTLSGSFVTGTSAARAAVGRDALTNDRYIYFWHNTDTFVVHVSASSGAILGIPGSFTGLPSALSQGAAMTADGAARVWFSGDIGSNVPRIYALTSGAATGTGTVTTHDMSAVGDGFSGSIPAIAYIAADNTLIVYGSYGGVGSLVKLDADDPTTVVASYDIAATGNRKEHWSRRGWNNEPDFLWFGPGEDFHLFDAVSLTPFETFEAATYTGLITGNEWTYDRVLRAYPTWHTSASANPDRPFIWLPRVPDGTIPRAQIIEQEAALVGLTVDVTGVTGTEIGYGVRDDAPPRKTIEDLMRVRSIDAAQIEGVLTFWDKATTSERLLSIDHIGAAQGAKPGTQLVKEILGDPFDLPPGVRLNYLAYAAQYRRGQQRMGMPESFEPEAGDLTFQTNLVLADDDAAKAADTLLMEARDVIAQYECKLMPREMDQHPGVVVTLPLDDGRTVGVVLAEMTQDMIIEAKYHRRVFDYVTDAVGAPTPDTTPVDINLSPARFQPLDIPIIADADDDEAFYFIVYPVGFGTFQSATVFKSTDNGQTWEVYGASTDPGIVGVAQTALADHAPWRTDKTNTLQVSFPTSPGVSVTAEEARNGANLFAIQAGQEWELVNVQTITDDGSGLYTLSNITRGRDGSDSFTGNHAAGDIVARLDDGSLKRSADTTSKDEAALFVAGTTGTIAPTFAVEFTNEALGNRPRAPAGFHAVRDGDDIDLDWTPCTRLMHGWLDGDVSSFGTGEASEAYEIDIFSGTDLLRTVTGLSARTHTYTLAQYQTDVGGSPAPGKIPKGIKFNLYKVSSTFGRGLPAIKVLSR